MQSIHLHIFEVISCEPLLYGQTVLCHETQMAFEHQLANYILLCYEILSC